MKDRDVARIKGAVIRRAIAVAESRDAERIAPRHAGGGGPRGGRLVGAVEERRKLGRRRDAVDNELIVAQSADHVEVDHCDGAVERQGTIRHEVLGPEKSHLLAAKGDEEERTPGW